MARVTSPWLPVEPLADDAFRRMRRRAIFDCCKWDPQVGDYSVIARHPLVVTRAAWDDVSRLARALANETLDAEAELVRRPDLHRALGLPRATRAALARAASAPSPGVARLIRFDFHFTAEGWRISEANADVPGGLNEASGFATLVGPHYPWAAPVGDPATMYVSRLLEAAGPGSTAALVHATAYSDDEQMMAYVGQRLEQAGMRAHLCSPSHLRWRGGRAHLDAAWWRGPLDLVVRFFPADWLGGLPRDCGADHLFGHGVTPLSNPATAILVQSKRFPLIWDELETPLPTWRALLPNTRHPGKASWRGSSDWILKPVLGRVGEGVGAAGLVDAAEWRKISRGATWWPRSWVAQRRFETLPVELAGRVVYPCLGVYTVDRDVAGAYGRLGATPLIDSHAQDAAVLAA
jgi:glutathionylspermidine synthase